MARGGFREGSGRPRKVELLRAAPLTAFPDEETAALAGAWTLGLLGDADQEAKAERGGLVLRAQGENLGTSGGFLVPSPIANAVINVREKYGSFRANAQVAPMGSDAVSVPRRTADLTATFIGESVTIADSSTAWDAVGLVAKKLGVLVKVSSELFEDSVIDIGNEIAEQMGQAFAKAEDGCGWNGDGTSTYGGMRGVTQLLIDGSHDGSKLVAAAGHDLFTEIDVADLSNLAAKLPSIALANAKWYVSPFGFANVFARLAATSGSTFVAAPAADGSLRAFYLGFPIVVTPSLPNSVASQTGKVMLCFGDLALAATLGDRRTLAVRTSRQRFIDNDQIGILATQRLDIVCHDLGTNAEAGPLVGLVGA